MEGNTDAAVGHLWSQIADNEGRMWIEAENAEPLSPTQEKRGELSWWWCSDMHVFQAALFSEHCMNWRQVA